MQLKKKKKKEREALGDKVSLCLVLDVVIVSQKPILSFGFCLECWILNKQMILLLDIYFLIYCVPYVGTTKRGP